MARPEVIALVPVEVEPAGGTSALAALGRFRRFRDELDSQLESIVQSAGVLKSDDVVDDGACDAIVASVRTVATAWNESMRAGGMAVKENKLNLPDELDPSPYQA